MTDYGADACNPANLPGWPIEWVYVDGACATTQLAGRRTISSVAEADADEGDVEPGNPDWSVWIPWVQRQRARGATDTALYCCDDGYGGSQWNGWRHSDGVAAFAAAGVPEPNWRVFNLTTSEVPPYAGALQVAVGVAPGYDVNVLGPSFPAAAGSTSQGGFMSDLTPAQQTDLYNKVTALFNQGAGTVNQILSLVEQIEAQCQAVYQWAAGTGNTTEADVSQLMTAATEIQTTLGQVKAALGQAPTVTPAPAKPAGQ